MGQLISKQELKKLASIPGEAMGMTIKPGVEFILKEEGENGLRELEKAMSDLGFQIDHKKIKPGEFYPLAFVNVLLVVIEKLFNFDDKKFRELGSFIAKFPVLLRRFTVWQFFTLRKFAKVTSRVWKQYYTVGNLIMLELDEKNKHMVYRLEDWSLTHRYCRVFEGFIVSATKLVVKNPVTCKEIKCVYKGDKYHDFSLRW